MAVSVVGALADHELEAVVAGKSPKTPGGTTPSASPKALQPKHGLPFFNNGVDPEK